MWGGRFSRRMLPELERFSASLEVDFELYPFDIAGSVAHARGLTAAGIITPAQLKAIERGLRRVKRELDEGTFEFASTDEDIHTAVERRLTELTPAGAALHAGRSTPDHQDLGTQFGAQPRSLRVMFSRSGSRRRRSRRRRDRRPP